jgi:predicted MFS family arabinose efflux permease
MYSRTHYALPLAFHRLGVSNFFAQFAEQIALAAAPLVAVLLLAAGPVETGWLQLAQTLPFLLLSIPAGILTDRMSRKVLMVGAEALRAVSLAAIVLLLWAGFLSVPLLAVAGFMGAVGTVCYSVAAPAIVPSLVAKEQLSNANRWLELVKSGAFVAGPALGGAVVGWAGASTAYVLATALSILAGLFLFALPTDRVPSAIKRSPIQDIFEGMNFVGRHSLLLPIVLTAIFFNIAWVVMISVYVAYAVQNLALTAGQVGFTLGVAGGGMVLGALVAPYLARHASVGTMVVLGPLGGLTGSLLMLATIWLPSFWLVCSSFLSFGFGPILWTITTVTLRQAVTPNAMLGRVSALVMTATYGARPLGAGIAAGVAATSGVYACLAVATVCFLIQFLIIVLSPVRRLTALPDTGPPPQTAYATIGKGAK